MASRTEGFGWLAVLSAVLVWVLCAVPLAAQSMLRFGGGEPMQPANSVAPADSIAPAGPGVPTSADALIEQMARAAGTIFAGQVTAVRRAVGFVGSGVDSAKGMVEIDFRVDLVVRGPAAGAVFTLREWPGQWAGNSRRYRIGQRLLVFLYPPDASGLSSPVHGAEGAMPLRGGGIAPGPDDTAAGAAEWNVDLRWLQAQVPRDRHSLTLPVREPISPVRPMPGRGNMPELYPEKTEVESNDGLSRRLPEPAPMPAAEPAEAEPLSQVVALCQQAMQEDAMGHHDGSR